jgi:hypothetical protein
LSAAQRKAAKTTREMQTKSLDNVKLD